MFWFGARPHPALGIVPFKASKKRSAAARSSPASSADSSYGELLGRKHAVNVQDHDELRVALFHALDKIGSNLDADLGRRFDLIRLQIDYPFHQSASAPMI